VGVLLGGGPRGGEGQVPVEIQSLVAHQSSLVSLIFLFKVISFRICSPSSGSGSTGRIVGLYPLLHLLSPEGGDVQGQQEVWMLLHVVVHLLLFVGGLAVFALIVLVLVEIPFALFIDLIFKLLVFEQEVLFVPIMFIELSLLFWGQLLSKVMPSRLGKRNDPSLFLSRPLTNLSIITGCFYASPCHLLLLLPILDLDSLALLVEMVM
jgi:hypothetical protein